LTIFMGPRAAYDAPGFLTWKYLYNTKMTIDLLTKAKNDPTLAAAIVEKGADKFIVDDGGDIFDKPASFWARSGGAKTMWEKYDRSTPIALPSQEALDGGTLFTADHVSDLATNFSCPSNKYAYGRLAIKSLLSSGTVNDDVLKAIFDKFDKDQSGYIDTDELQNLSHCTGISLTYDQAVETLAKLDTDGDGKLEFEEFAAWLKESHATEYAPTAEQSGGTVKVSNPMQD
jgi:hypothetical protein